MVSLGTYLGLDKIEKGHIMTKLEKQFSHGLIQKMQTAETLYGYRGIRQKEEIEKHGGVACVKRALARDGSFHSFPFLQEHGHLELTAEALVVDQKFSVLFEDEEVNLCLELLCDGGYFGVK